MKNEDRRMPAHELILKMLDSWSGIDGVSCHGIGGDHSSYGLGERNILLIMLNGIAIPENKVDNFVNELNQRIKKLRQANQKETKQRTKELRNRFEDSVTYLEECITKIKDDYKK